MLANLSSFSLFQAPVLSEVHSVVSLMDPLARIAPLPTQVHKVKHWGAAATFPGIALDC
jgi:hypothetical protein